MSDSAGQPDPVNAGTAPHPRLLSLDVLRGLTVVGMIIVNSAAGIAGSGEVFPTLLHSHWAGLTLADLVFPGFLMMMGVSIPLALGRLRAEQGLTAEQRRHILGRTVRLFVLGFVLSNLWWFSDFAATSWRLFGVLQRIGLVYGACALLFFLCGPKVRLAIIAAILLLYWPLTLIPSPDGLSTDIWVRGHNFVAAIDRILLGAGNHNYVKGPEGYDPEGLLGTLPAIAHGLIGVAIGEYLRGRHPNAPLRLALAGLIMAVIGIVWGFAFPVVKDIWSSTFVLLTCGLTTILLALLHLWLDRDAAAPSGAARLILIVALPFGINAIAAYVIHQLTSSMIGWDLLTAPFEATRGALGDRWATLIPIFLYLLFIWVCVDALRRKNWIVKI